MTKQKNYSILINWLYVIFGAYLIISSMSKTELYVHEKEYKDKNRKTKIQ